MEHFRKKIANNRVLFPQETHSSDDAAINWHDDFKGKLLFSYGITNSCGDMIGYLGNKTNKVYRIKIDNQGRIVIVDADIVEETFFGLIFITQTLKRNKLKLFVSSIIY